MESVITPEMILEAYAEGVFPMAESADSDEVIWVDPDTRAIIPLDSFHVPKSLKRFMRKSDFTLSINQDFTGVIKACAERDETWINKSIMESYVKLHEMGFAHSIECWDNGRLVGGLYGIMLWRAFFGETMFSRKTNASKVCLVYLVHILRERGFILLDAQFMTDHLKQFGAVEITRSDYHILLSEAKDMSQFDSGVKPDADIDGVDFWDEYL